MDTFDTISPSMATINGTNDNDLALNGTSADDIINGLAGDDFLFGGFGNDILNGGIGSDRFCVCRLDFLSCTGGFLVVFPRASNSKDGV